MTNKDFFDVYRGKPALYKGKDIGAYVAGYVGEKYIILGFHDYTGCILRFTARVNKTLDGVYTSYRFAKLKYVEVVDKSTDKKSSLLIRLYYYLYRLYSCSFLATRTKE